jgi:hypothetical protein
MENSSASPVDRAEGESAEDNGQLGAAAQV